MGWEDTLLPSIEKTFAGERSDLAEVDWLWEDWPQRTTYNHRAMIRTVRLGADYDRGRGGALAWLRDQQTSGFCGHECLSSVYDLFEMQAVAGMTRLAYERRDMELWAECWRWWSGLVALYQAVAVAAHGRRYVVSAGARCNRPYSEERSLALSLLSTHESDYDPLSKEKIRKAVSTRSSLELYYIAELLRSGQLPLIRASTETTLRDIPPLSFSLLIERSSGGVRTTIDQLPGVDAPQWQTLARSNAGGFEDFEFVRLPRKKAHDGRIPHRLPEPGGEPLSTIRVDGSGASRVPEA